MFVIISIFVTLSSILFPRKLLNPDNRWFREKTWEVGGDIYQRLFKVRRWKAALPELSDFFKILFPKKKIKTFGTEYLQSYIIESCRAELTHFCIIGATILFALWAGLSASLIIVYISVLLNLPFIVIQRYNRPRIQRLLTRSQHHTYPGIKAEDLSY
jgi:glycosyl-4,4'-diaponeurosporenoate acyltransferase